MKDSFDFCHAKHYTTPIPPKQAGRGDLDSYQISVCLGTACYVKGSGDVYAKIEEILGIKGGECTSDRKFSLDACRCVGACGLAPVMTINGEVYGKITPGEVKGILEKYM